MSNKKGRKKLTDEEKAERKEKAVSESKEDKFVRLANMRMRKALKAIQLIGNLSGSGYKYSPEQTETITNTLNRSVSVTMEKFVKVEKTEIEFTL